MARKSFMSLVVRVGFWALGKGAMRASVLDQHIRKEVRQWKDGFTIALGVLPNGPIVSWTIKNGRMKYLGFGQPAKADLIVWIKSIKAAFRMIMAQMGIAQAYAFRRIAIEGNTVDAMVLTRILDIVEAYLFPRFLSKKLLKQVPHFGIHQYWNNLLIYFGLVF